MVFNFGIGNVPHSNANKAMVHGWIILDMHLDDLKFWNDVFHSKFPKYKDCLDASFDHLPLAVISVNSHISHVFSDL
jgi:hypothetical protein